MDRQVDSSKLAQRTFGAACLSIVPREMLADSTPWDEATWIIGPVHRKSLHHPRRDSISFCELV